MAEVLERAREHSSNTRANILAFIRKHCSEATCSVPAAYERSPQRHTLPRLGWAYRPGREHLIHFYDTFVHNAFGNYRDLLKQVTRRPRLHARCTECATHLARRNAIDLRNTRRMPARR